MIIWSFTQLCVRLFQISSKSNHKTAKVQNVITIKSYKLLEQFDAFDIIVIVETMYDGPNVTHSFLKYNSV